MEIDPGAVDELENGTYFVDGDLRRADPLEIDVGEGDVTLVVDGHVQLDGASIDVVGAEEGSGVARAYATGDVAIANGGSGVAVEDDEAGRFQLYGTSEMHFALGQGSFVGTVYAPRREPAEGINEAAADGLGSSDNCGPIDGDPPDVCLGQGNVEFVGSIVSGPMSVERSSDLHYDEDLQDVEPSLATDGIVLPPALTHVHVAVHEMAISDD